MLFLDEERMLEDREDVRVSETITRVEPVARRRSTEGSESVTRNRSEKTRGRGGAVGTKEDPRRESCLRGSAESNFCRRGSLGIRNKLARATRRILCSSRPAAVQRTKGLGRWWGLGECWMSNALLTAAVDCPPSCSYPSNPRLLPFIAQISLPL